MTAEATVYFLLEHGEDEEFDIKSFIMKRPPPKKIEIWGKRWFSRTYGSTYFRFYVYTDGQLIHSSELHSGYGDYYLEVAVDWLADNGYVGSRKRHPNGSTDPAWVILKDLKEQGTEVLYHVTDVKRQRDT